MEPPGALEPVLNAKDTPSQSSPFQDLTQDRVFAPASRKAMVVTVRKLASLRLVNSRPSFCKPRQPHKGHRAVEDGEWGAVLLALLLLSFRTADATFFHV